MPWRSNHSRGFTLVEILIVVVVLGILATVVIPQFSNATDMARHTSIKALLKTLRIQLEVYKAHHHDQYPQLSQLWDNLVQRTDSYGNLDANGRYGGYLQQPPIHQFTSSSNVVGPGLGTANDGWEYDETTGEITAVGFDETTGVYTAP